MEQESKIISRKGFLNIVRDGFCAGAIVNSGLLNNLSKEHQSSSNWLELSLEELPKEMYKFRRMFEQIQNLEINDGGWLAIPNSSEIVNIIDTELNRSQTKEEIYSDIGGIPIQTMVILQKTSLNNSENYDNSCHFLVDEKSISQTKFPSEDGRPQIAWGIRWSDPDLSNPYANALRDLVCEKDFKDTFYPSLLKYFHHEPDLDTRRRSIAVKVNGEIGDDVEVSDKLMANILSVLRPLKKYNINPWNIVDNREMYGNGRVEDEDIGVETAAEIRHYLGVIALINGSQEEIELVFGQFSKLGDSNIDTIIRYFKANREYLKKVLTARDFHDWDAKTKYQFFMDKLEGNEPMPIADKFIHPIDCDSGGGYRYKDETQNIFTGEMSGFHTGHDYNIGSGNEDEGEPFMCSANGKVVYAGTTNNGMGNTIIVKHRLTNGSDVYSRYGHCQEINVKAGEEVKMGDLIGTIGRTGYEDNPDFFAHLHFDIIYAKTYEEFMIDRPEYYDHDSKEWIDRRFVYPKEWIESFQNEKELIDSQLEAILKNMHQKSLLSMGVK